MRTEAFLAAAGGYKDRRLLIVLERLSSDGLYVRRERKAGLTLLAAIPFLGMALVPLIAPDLTLLRAVTSVVLFLVSAGLFLLGLRSQVVERRFDASELAKASSVLLTGTHPRAGFGAYRAELCFEDGTQSVLFQHRSPEFVLCDLKRLLETMPLPVRNTWGLPDHVEPWNANASPKALMLPPQLHERARLWPAQNQTAWTVIVAASVVCGIVAIMLISRLRRGESISALSWALPLVSLSSALVAGAAVRTWRVEFIRRGDELVIQKTVFGRVFQRRVLPAHTLRAVYAVGAGAPQHLLFITDSETFSVPCFGPNAYRIQRELGALPS